MTKSNPKLFSQIMILVLLVLVIIGFTLPAALDYNSNGQIVVEPRYCKTDSECYLICEDKPVEIFCTQNMCVQNACNEANYYAFNSAVEPITYGNAMRTLKTIIHSNATNQYHTTT